MATKIGQELVEFTFGQEQTTMANGQRGFDPAQLDSFTKAVEAYEREFKRVFGSLVTTMNTIDQQTGQAIRKIFIPKLYEQQALGVRSAVYQQRFGQGIKDKDLMYLSQQQAHFLETTREIKGAKAQQFAREAVLDVGGKIQHTAGTANKDMMTTFIPISDSQLQSMSSKDVASYVRNVTPDSNSASRAEAVERARKEKDEQLERDAKRQQALFRENKKDSELRAREREAQSEQYEKDLTQDQKDKVASRKQTFGVMGKILTVVTVLTDIARRILTSVLNFASETSKQQTKANTLNMSLQDVRDFNYLDRALGLDAGTQLQAQEDLRSKFGNTAKLDTEALKWLSMVMGDKVSTMVQSGLGGENPAYLMEQIMDDFFKRQQEGKDQYGNYVGQDKARRALVTLLESVSPSIARTFERMVEEQTSGLHAGDITSFRQLQSFYLPAQGFLDSADWNMITLLGKETDELKTKFYNLGELIKGDLTLAFKDTISALNNLHIGENEEEIFNANKSDYEQLIAWGKEYASQKAGTAERLGQFFGGYDALAGMSIEDIVRYAGYDTAGTEGAERAKIQGARSAVEAIYKNPSLYNDLLLYYASSDMLSAVDKEQHSSNPNASPTKYGDAGLLLARRNAESVYLEHLGFLKSNELAFTDALFTRSIGDGAMIYSDVISDKQKYFASGADAFFTITKESSSSSHYRDVLKELIKKYNKRFGTKYELSEILNAIGSDTMTTELRNLFTFGTIYSGMSASAMGTLQGFAKYLPDEYGLTPSEWDSIYDKVGDITSRRKYKNYKLSSVNVAQGSSAGTIDINVNLIDEKGNITSVKESVAGTIDESVKLDESLKLIGG